MRSQPLLPASEREMPTAEEASVMFRGILPEVIRHTTLADLSAEFMAAIDAVEEAVYFPDQPDVLEAAMQSMEAVKLSVDDKLLSYHYVRRERLGNIETRKREIVRLENLNRRDQGVVDWLDDNALGILRTIGRKFKNAFFAVHIGRSESLVIVDEAKLPTTKKFWKPQPPNPILKELKNSLLSGEISESDGVKIEKHEHLVWK